MNTLAANRTARRPGPAMPTGQTTSACSGVEDLNWPLPLPLPSPDRKAPRMPEMWMPGPDELWNGFVPTLR